MDLFHNVKADFVAVVHEVRDSRTLNTYLLGKGRRSHLLVCQDHLYLFVFHESNCFLKSDTKVNNCSEISK